MIKINMKNNNNIKTIAIKSYFHPYENRKQIYKENRNKSGIYCWNNLMTQELYIGSAANLTKRLYHYLSTRYLENANKKHRSIIYNAILKYVYINFSFNVLKYCDISELIKWEQYYMNLLNPKYNILKIAGSTLGHKHSHETLTKLKNYKPSTEALVKLRLAKELTGNIVIIINKNNNYIKKYKSLHSAAKDLNVSRAGLLYCIKKGVLLKGTYLIIRFIKIEL